MIFRSFSSVLFLLLTLFAITPKNHAQTSVYGTGAAAAFGFSGQDYNGTQLKPRTPGFIAGAFYMLPGRRAFRFGFDGRYTFAPSYNGGNAFTGAIRVGFAPGHLALHPYAEFGGGAVSTQLRQSCNGLSCTPTLTQLTSGVVQYGAGLDIRANRLVDIRAIDYQYDTGGRAGVTHAAMQSLSAGLVFHFGHPEIKRR